MRSMEDVVASLDGSAVSSAYTYKYGSLGRKNASPAECRLSTEHSSRNCREQLVTGVIGGVRSEERHANPGR